MSAASLELTVVQPDWAPANGRVRLLAVSLYSCRSRIGLFKEANASTPIHESGHEWPDELVTDASEAGAWAEAPDCARGEPDLAVRGACTAARLRRCGRASGTATKPAGMSAPVTWRAVTPSPAAHRP